MIQHLMCLSAHHVHANQAFVFGHWQELECFWHSSQILSGLDGPTSADTSADALTFHNDCQEITSQFRIPETTFWNSPRQCLPSGPSSPLFVVSTSGTNQFPTIQTKLTTHFQLPLPGLFQGLIPDHLILLFLPFPLFLLLCLPFLPFLFNALVGCC